MRSSRFALLVLAFLMLPMTYAADPTSPDWAMFRGPKRDGVSTDTGLLKEWPKDGPPLEWKCPGIGIGFSSVAVSGDKVFTMGDVKRVCYAFGINRKDGTKIWEAKIGNGGGNYEGPRCTPTVVGDSVFVLGQNGDLVCLATADGAERWRKSLPNDFGGQSGGWNYTESPLVDGDKIICTPGGNKATMVALNQKDGKVIWSGVIPNGSKAGYSSIVIAEIGGVRQYVQLMANGLVSFAAKDGKLLWTYGTNGDRFSGNTANIPTPIVRGDTIFASAGYGRGAALIRVTGTAAKFNVTEIYWNRALTNKHGGVILVGDRLYGDRDDGGQLWCADFKSGKVLWTPQERPRGSGSISLTAAEGKLYLRYSNGWVALVNPTKGYSEISTFKIPNGDGDCWAHPVVIGGKFYVRERDTLWCYNVKEK